MKTILLVIAQTVKYQKLLVKSEDWTARKIFLRLSKMALHRKQWTNKWKLLWEDDTGDSSFLLIIILCFFLFCFPFFIVYNFFLQSFTIAPKEKEREITLYQLVRTLTSIEFSSICRKRSMSWQQFTNYLYWLAF